VTVRVSRELPRGCGFRKPGGLYLVSDRLGEPCPRLPLILQTCPTCGAGIRPARGWTWVNPPTLFPAMQHGSVIHSWTCPLGLPAGQQPSPEFHRCGERAGLLWVGEQFYPTVESFMAEAAEMGVSRRIAHVPREFVLGETWVFLGHRKAQRSGYWDTTTNVHYIDLNAAGLAGADAANLREYWLPGVVTLFKPIRVEYVLRPGEDENESLLEALDRRGITPVAVVQTQPQTTMKEHA